MADKCKKCCGEEDMYGVCKSCGAKEETNKSNMNEYFGKIASIIGILVCAWGIFAIINIGDEMGNISTGDIMKLMELSFMPLLGLLIAITGAILKEISKNSDKIKI